MINEYCPLHWYLPVSSKIGNIDEYVHEQSIMSNGLLFMLIASVAVTFGYFLFFT
jgi:hypothetical protein